MLSKTTLLENFKHSSHLLLKEDGQTPYREYMMDSKFLPKEVTSLQGDWKITVTFSPHVKKEISAKKKVVKSTCYFFPSFHNQYTACSRYVGMDAPRPWVPTISDPDKVTCSKCLKALK